MFLSIVIPAFNRPDDLGDLLQSIKRQENYDVEIVICEDCSPERVRIELVALKYQKILPNLKFIKNEKNLGYDANLRKVISEASGKYVILCGNDDLFAENAINIIEYKLKKYNPVVLLRSYKSFYKKIQDDTKFNTHKYVKKDTLVKVDKEHLAWLYYRSVLVSGLVIDRKLAISYASDEVDGMLYYQNYIISQVSQHGNILYVPDILIYNRLVDFGDFGSSEVEKEGFTPGERSIDSSVFQMKGFFKVAQAAQMRMGIDFEEHLIKIASAYSFPLLSYHRDKGLHEFVRFSRSLKNLGYKGPYFCIYQLLLIVLNVKISLKIINILKFIFGKTITLIR